MKCKVFSNKETTTTITKFCYGNGYRVQLTTTANDPANSRLIDHYDKFFNNEINAITEFDNLVSTTKQMYN